MRTFAQYKKDIMELNLAPAHAPWAMPPDESERAWRRENASRLTVIAEEWRRTGTRPEAAGVLSSGELSAVCIAAGQTTSLRDPVYAFLMLDDWMQKWVLDAKGLAHFAGRPIAAGPWGY